MKSLLNLRRAALANGAASALPFSQDEARHLDPADSAGLSVNGEHDAPPGTDGHPVTAPVRPVTTLHPVQTNLGQSNGRSVSIADATEVERLMEEAALTSFQVFRSFDYSVSLLFHVRELKYYVALYQDGHLWRALAAHDLTTAKSLFHHLQDQAIRLADGQTRRLQLEAQNEQLKRLIARSETEAERLRRGVQRTATHDHEVTNRQHQLRKEVSQLEAQRAAAQAQLNKMQRQVHQLNIASNEGMPHLAR